MLHSLRDKRRPLSRGWDRRKEKGRKRGSKRDSAAPILQTVALGLLGSGGSVGTVQDRDPGLSRGSLSGAAASTSRTERLRKRTAPIGRLKRQSSWSRVQRSPSQESLPPPTSLPSPSGSSIAFPGLPSMVHPFSKAMAQPETARTASTEGSLLDESMDDPDSTILSRDQSRFTRFERVESEDSNITPPSLSPRRATETLPLKPSQASITPPSPISSPSSFALRLDTSLPAFPATDTKPLQSPPGASSAAASAAMGRSGGAGMVRRMGSAPKLSLSPSSPIRDASDKEVGFDFGGDEEERGRGQGGRGKHSIPHHQHHNVHSDSSTHYRDKVEKDGSVHLRPEVRKRLDKFFLPKVRTRSNNRGRRRGGSSRRSSISSVAEGMARERHKSVLQLAAALVDGLRTTNRRGSLGGGGSRRGSIVSQAGESEGSAVLGGGKEDGESEEGEGGSDGEVEESSETRELHPALDVSRVHGTLLYGPDAKEPNTKFLRELMASTGFSRRRLYQLFIQFKAMCRMAKTPEGIDRETFRHMMPLLSMEDSKFANRVYSILDEDGSESIEWEEFLTAISKLQYGTKRQRAMFLFDVYDDDGGGSIDNDELYRYFVASMWLKDEDITPLFREVCRDFTVQVLAEVDPENDGELYREKVLEFINKTDVEDVGSIFGRGLVTSESSDDLISSLGINAELQELLQYRTRKLARSQSRKILSPPPPPRTTSKTSTTTPPPPPPPPPAPPHQSSSPPQAPPSRTNSSPPPPPPPPPLGSDSKEKTMGKVVEDEEEEEEEEEEVEEVVSVEDIVEA